MMRQLAQELEKKIAIVHQDTFFRVQYLEFGDGCDLPSKRADRILNAQHSDWKDNQWGHFRGLECVLQLFSPIVSRRIDERMIQPTRVKKLSSMLEARNIRISAGSCTCPADIHVEKQKLTLNDVTICLRCGKCGIDAAAYRQEEILCYQLEKLICRCLRAIVGTHSNLSITNVWLAIQRICTLRSSEIATDNGPEMLISICKQFGQDFRNEILHMAKESKYETMKIEKMWESHAKTTVCRKLQFRVYSGNAYI